jgi:hypothetical protein
MEYLTESYVIVQECKCTYANRIETLLHIIKQTVMQVSFHLAFKRPFQKRLLWIHHITTSKMINNHTVETSIQNLFVNNKQITIHTLKKLSQNRKLYMYTNSLFNMCLTNNIDNDTPSMFSMPCWLFEFKCTGPTPTQCIDGLLQY